MRTILLFVALVLTLCAQTYRAAPVHADTYFSPVNLPFRGTLPDLTFETLLAKLRTTSGIQDKIRIARTSVLGRPEFLTSSQGLRLLKAFDSAKDVVTLRSLLKERLLGVTCRELIAFLDTFPSETEKLNVLPAFKNSIVDFQNKSSVANSFTVASHRKAAEGLLDTFVPHSSLISALTGRIAFVLDMSGSMNTPFVADNTQFSRFSYLKLELEIALNSLINTPSFFNVILFNEHVYTWRPNLQFASQNNVQSAVTWFNAFSPSGTTKPSMALETAFNLTGVETIVFLSDGFPNGSDDLPAKLIALTKQLNPTSRVVLNTILLGMGGDDDRELAKGFMHQLAQENGGSYKLLEFD